MLPRLASLALLVLLPGSCADRPRGDLEVHWSLNGDRDPAACQTAGVASVRVLVDHTGTPPDSDPTDPEWSFVDLPCDAGHGTLRLTEGIYRVRLVALDGAGEARSGFADLVGVEVVEGGITFVPNNPAVEPPVDLTVPICGDGVVQPGEWCDASDLGGYACANRGFDGGVLGCTATCTLDESGCTTCGDGVLAPGEACDASDLGGLTCAGLGWESGTLACAADCSLDETGCVGCGNGQVDPGETCDDGNRVSGDGCSASCQVE
jgi:cysteine-rich repeat protein